MPRAKRHCGIQGCLVIVPNGQRCPQHSHGWGKGAQRTGTHQHKQWSKAVRQRDKRCIIQLPGCTGNPDTADHIIPVHLGGAPYDLANGQAACLPCHGSKSSGEGHAAQGHNRRSDPVTRTF